MGMCEAGGECIPLAVDNTDDRKVQGFLNEARVAVSVRVIAKTAVGCAMSNSSGHRMADYQKARPHFRAGE